MRVDLPGNQPRSHPPLPQKITKWFLNEHRRTALICAMRKLDQDDMLVWAMTTAAVVVTVVWTVGIIELALSLTS
jgi:hypothetical protein